MPTIRWKSPKDDDLLKELRGRGLYIREISKLMSFSAVTICVKMRGLGITNNSKVGRQSGQDKRKLERNQNIILDVKNGLSVIKVAEKYNLTPQRIIQITKPKVKNG